MFKDKPLISVIVPIYMIDRYIGICIESIINQTYENLEIILVDDGSKDRCGVICDLFAKKDNRIKVIHKENGGLVSARKAGLEISTGELIGYVDGDDWIEPTFYEKLYEDMVASDADVVCAGQSRDLFNKSVHFINNLPVGVYENESLNQLISGMMSFGDFFRHGVFTYVWNKLFKRKVLFDYQMNVDNRITVGEDGAVVYPVICACKRVCITNHTLYHYRQREDSMLKQSDNIEKEILKIKYLYEYLLKVFDKKFDNNDFEIQRQVVEYVFMLCIYRLGGLFPGENLSIGYSAFGKDFFEKKVVVFSAGTFGQQLMIRLNSTDCCNVELWVDDDYWEYRRCALDVDPVDSVVNADFDYVLIATAEKMALEKSFNRLIELGIEKQKLLCVNVPDYETMNDIIKKLLYN